MISDKTYNTIVKIMKALFLLLLFSMLAYGIYYNETDNVTYNGWIDDLQFIENWETKDENGAVIPVDMNKTYPYSSDGSFEISSNLPLISSDHVYLAFLTIQDTEVYIDGKLRNDLKISRDIHIWGGPVKNFYFFTLLNEADSGKPVRIVKHPFSRFKTECSVPEVITGTMADIYKHVFDMCGIPFILDLLLLSLSIMIIIAGLIIQLRHHLSVSMVFAGFGVFLTTGWMITDSYFYPFTFGHNHIDGLLSYLFCLLIPIPFLAYLSSLQKRRNNVFYVAQFAFILVNFFLWTTLHFLGILKFFQSLFLIDTYLIISIIATVFLLIKEYRDGYMKTYIFTAIGLIGFSVSACAEIVTILIPSVENTGNFLLFGLLFLLSFAVIQQFEDFRAAEEQRARALELSDAKSNFLARMSHEIRTPINSILGMNEMILRENHDPVIESYASTVQSSGHMLLSLVNDVLDFSKIEAGRFEITKDEYRLSSLLNDVSTLAKERASRKGLACNIEIGENVPDGLYSDEFRIKQILVNLISNAVKYTDKGSVSIKVRGDYSSKDIFDLTFDVEDTGRGIKEEDKKLLFDAFSRIDLKTNRSIEGTGLGLAIVKSIVNSLDGTLKVESAYKKGSVFTVTIPQKVMDRTPVPADLATSISPETHAARHICDYTAPDACILAVDDNRPNLSIVKEFLKITKVRLDLCLDGNQALAKCKELRYDLILLDHMMPEPDGIETLKMIRNDEQSLNKETPAVVLTANAVAGGRQMYLDEGFADYLTKPLDSALLEQTVKKYIPKEKIVSTNSRNDDLSMEFEPVGTEEKKLYTCRPEDIEGIDYEAALRHSGGYVDILIPVMHDIAESGPEKAEQIRKAVVDGDLETYRLNSHSIKGTMATIGADKISEAAKLHESAAKEGDIRFIEENFEGFLNEYEDLCKRILEVLDNA